jgi:hypothetical protein
LEPESKTPEAGRDVFEGAVAAVPEQPAGVAAIGFGGAVRLLLAVEAAEHVGGLRPLDVVAHEQVQPPVAIEVHPERRGAEPDAAVEAAGARDVHERPLARVAEQPASARRR